MCAFNDSILLQKEKELAVYENEQRVRSLAERSQKKREYIAYLKGVLRQGGSQLSDNNSTGVYLLRAVM